jgi:hypothetical protein
MVREDGIYELFAQNVRRDRAVSARSERTLVLLRDERRE